LVERHPTETRGSILSGNSTAFNGYKTITTTTRTPTVQAFQDKLLETRSRAAGAQGARLGEVDIREAMRRALVCAQNAALDLPADLCGPVGVR
jgi:hypothetical protein